MENSVVPVSNETYRQMLIKKYFDGFCSLDSADQGLKDRVEALSGQITEKYDNVLAGVFIEYAIAAENARDGIAPDANAIITHGFLIGLNPFLSARGEAGVDLDDFFQWSSAGPSSMEEILSQSLTIRNRALSELLKCVPKLVEGKLSPGYLLFAYYNDQRILDRLIGSSPLFDTAEHPVLELFKKHLDVDDKEEFARLRTAMAELAQPVFAMRRKLQENVLLHGFSEKAQGLVPSPHSRSYDTLLPMRAQACLNVMGFKQMVSLDNHPVELDIGRG